MPARPRVGGDPMLQESVVIAAAECVGKCPPLSDTWPAEPIGTVLVPVCHKAAARSLFLALLHRLQLFLPWAPPAPAAAEVLMKLRWDRRCIACSSLSCACLIG
jgi:hypothetical protein